MGQESARILIQSSTRQYFLFSLSSVLTRRASSRRRGLVGRARVALVGGSLRDFQLHARLLLLHQHLGRQAPAAQAGLEEGGREGGGERE